MAGMACDNIAKNIIRLVEKPKILTVHLSEVCRSRPRFYARRNRHERNLSAILIITILRISKNSRNLSKKQKFRYWQFAAHINSSANSFGAKLMTLDDLEVSEKRTNRIVEYQYRFVKIIDTKRPDFSRHATTANRAFGKITQRNPTFCASGKITECRSTAFPKALNCSPLHIFAKIK